MSRDLDSLARGIARCHKCPLGDSRTHAVPGEGPEDADVMLVGEAPGRQEDQEGRPFIGMAGTILDGILEASGWSRDELFITSSVKCRPPDNRPPRAEELETCREAWLWRQIEAVQPELVVLLGHVAMQSVLGRRDPLEDLRGELVEDAGQRFLVTYHPSGAVRREDGEEEMTGAMRRARRIVRSD